MNYTNRLSVRGISTISVLALCIALIAFSQCSCGERREQLSQSQIDSMRAQIAQLTAGDEMVKRHLATFDTLDYTVFSNQEWTRLHESHAANIIVHWPDGHSTQGIERHIEDLKAMFVYAPNTAIHDHPIRFGSNTMSCVTGVMTGTFTQPMPAGPGKMIQPTGQSFSLPMCTVGIWKDGVMVEEYLYWDNHYFMTQLGLTK